MAATSSKKTAISTDFITSLFQSNLDMAKLADAQQRNMEALMEAQRVAFDGYKSAMEKQVSVMKDAMEQMTGAAGEAFSGKTPEANAAKQMEMAQTAMKSTFDNVREMAELATKANQSAFAILQERFTAGLEEMKSAGQK